MKKLKKFWHENSVLLVLLMILIACLVAISVVVITYFVGDSDSKHGDRNALVNKYPFSEKEQKQIISKLEEDELIKSASMRVSETMTIYLKIEFEVKTTLVEAQSKALSSLDYFSEDVLSFYDIEFMIDALATEDTEGFQISGSHNVSGTGGIVWNNNTIVNNEEK